MLLRKTKIQLLGTASIKQSNLHKLAYAQRIALHLEKSHPMYTMTVLVEEPF